MPESFNQPPDSRRAVITGYGLVSCLGPTPQAITEALKNGQAGYDFNPVYAQMGLKSQVSGSPTIDLNSIDRKLRRFMGPAAAFAYASALSAIEHAGLTVDDIGNNARYGVIAGSGGASTASVVEGADTLRQAGVRKVAPTLVPRSMTSTVTAALATGLKIHGTSYAISSACATSAHCIGHAMELIQLGKQDLILAGGGEEEHWSETVLFDAMTALSTQFNDMPKTASRPYSIDRDGFVIAGGGGIVVIESLAHAKARNAPILAEIVGYGATSDGADMVAPNGEGAMRCMQLALEQALECGITQIDYINTHGTSTPLGDGQELTAIAQAFQTPLPQSKQIFAKQIPPLSSTKSMSGHSLGATGVHEVIYSLMMMQHGFIAPSINITELDPIAKPFDIVQQTRFTPVSTVLSNSFGFGGTNAALILQKWIS